MKKSVSICLKKLPLTIIAVLFGCTADFTTDSAQKGDVSVDTAADTDTDIDTDTVSDTDTDADTDTDTDTDTGDGNCASPFTAGLGSQSGDVTSTGDNYETVCDPYGGADGSGPDEFWKFTSDANGNLIIEMSPTGWHYCAIEVMSVCGDDNTALECDAEPFPPNDSFCTLSMYVTAGTSYYIVTESHSQSNGGGPYTLTLTM